MRQTTNNTELIKRVLRHMNSINTKDNQMVNKLSTSYGRWGVNINDLGSYNSTKQFKYMYHL